MGDLGVESGNHVMSEKECIPSMRNCRRAFPEAIMHIRSPLADVTNHLPNATYRI